MKGIIMCQYHFTASDLEANERKITDENAPDAGAPL
jgi:hypothetical protein